MKSKLFLAGAGALFAGAGSAFAQAPAVVPAPTSVTVTATVSAVSQYMFRGLRLSGAGLQPAVEVGAGNLALGGWSNVPFDGDKVPDSSDPETDLYGSYNFALEGGLALTPGFTVYHYPKAPTNAGFYRTTFEPSIALGYTVDGVRLTPKIYYDVVLKGPTYEMTALYALPLTGIGSELDFTLTYGSYRWKEAANHAAPAVKTWGQYGMVEVAAPFQITPTARLTFRLAYAEGRKAFTKAGQEAKAPNSLAVGRGVVTLSYTRSF